MKKTLCIFIILSGLFCSVSGQNSGYMGHRFIIGIDGVFSPSWRVPNFWGENRFYAFNYILSPGMEIIVAKKTSVGACYQYFTTKFNADTWTNMYQGDIKTHGFGVFFKQYFGQTRAPMGLYIRGEFNGYFYNYKVPSIANYDPYDHNYANYQLNDSGMLFGMKFEFGKNFVLLNRLTLSSGISAGFTIGGFSSNDSDYDFHNAVKNRILRMYWIGFRLGVGVIAF